MPKGNSIAGMATRELYAGCVHQINHSVLIIEGDNFDSLRLLRSTHAGRIRVIYIDPPYNTGNTVWVL